MYLKQIEIHGFKSFSNNTILNFEKGITAIVGPNGSGKSNIADAVRWVLGEQKIKQLRGSNMQDVIFSGTENRKAQGFAYVNIIIDNKDRKLLLDYDEIQVSRRLYRSGESEYKLNNVECRLKDINEIFYDTGIGKEGYSIIGQGQIDKILSDKPEDRREMFDEAVGIVKYKRRKAIAMKNLNEAKLNLSRIEDIKNELEKQIAPLKEQSINAKKYLSLRDEIVIYESNYFVREIDNETNVINDCKKNQEIAKNDLDTANQKKNEYDKKYAEIDTKITNVDLEIASIKDDIFNLSNNKEKLQGKINVVNEQINSNAVYKKNRFDRLKVINENLDNKITEIFNYLSTMEILKKQIKFISENNTMHNKEQLLNDLKLLEDAINEVKENVFLAMGDNYVIDIKTDTTTIFSDDSLFSNLEKKRKELENIDNKIDIINEKIKKLDNDLYLKTQNLTEINNNIMNAQNEFHANESRLDAIKNMLERYEGYSNVVKNVMDNKISFSGIKGVVADLIETNKEYEVAIEIALGNTIQNIVTDNTDTVKDIINYLKENKLGRATFLPINSLKVVIDDNYNKARNEEGVIDIAINLVQYKNEYENLAKYLLSRCLVVDNYDNAVKISKKYKSDLKIVTLAGEIFNPGGSISGGAFKNASNLIGRKREYDELMNICEKNKNAIDKFNQDKIRASEEYDIIYKEIENNKKDLNEFSIERNTVTLNIINDLKLEYSQISLKNEFTCNEATKSAKELIAIAFEKVNIENEDNESINFIKDKNDEIESYTNEINKLNVDIENCEKNIELKNKERETYLLNRKDFYDSKDKTTNLIVNLEQELIRLKSLEEKSEEKISNLTSQMIDKYNLTYNDAFEKYNEKYNDVSLLKKLIKEKRKEIDDLGYINVNAIEDYKNVADRYELILTQYNDSKSSEVMISKIVKDLDDNMKKQFDENFKFIKQEFQKVFTELFGGGKATLELLEVDDKDHNNILDAGVQIIVQPPGKKLENMMQLSGGEKALTAIALIFAIQNLKPSPFCLLDEIEAALDESNVFRFSTYLKKLEKETQFIVITHRRGTMNNADRLYGVTMQEKGITTLVSVDLIEDKLN